MSGYVRICYGLSHSREKSVQIGHNGTRWDLWGFVRAKGTYRAKLRNHDKPALIGPYGTYGRIARKLRQRGQIMEYRGKHRKMRLSTKIGLIRLMRSKGMNISYTAIFAKAA